MSGLGEDRHRERWDNEWVGGGGETRGKMGDNEWFGEERHWER